MQLDSSISPVWADAHHCRFCERTPSRASFSLARPVVQGVPGTTLFSAQVCDECQEDCRDPIASHCENFWKTAHAGGDPLDVVQGHEFDALALFKSLVASALLIMPEDELAYFTDTLEWVNNPDHDYDGGLFADTLLPSLPVCRRRRSGRGSAWRDGSTMKPRSPTWFLFCRGGNRMCRPPCRCVCATRTSMAAAQRTPRRSLIAGEGPTFTKPRDRRNCGCERGRVEKRESGIR